MIGLRSAWVSGSVVQSPKAHLTARQRRARTAPVVGSHPKADSSRPTARLVRHQDGATACGTAIRPSATRGSTAPPVSTLALMNDPGTTANDRFELVIAEPGVELAVQRSGEGPTVLLVGGLGMPSITWEICGLPRFLVDAGFQVIAYNRAGCPWVLQKIRSACTQTHPWLPVTPSCGRDCRLSSSARMLTTKPRTGRCFYTNFRTRPTGAPKTRSPQTMRAT
jgi:hypothetical protein